MNKNVPACALRSALRLSIVVLVLSGPGGWGQEAKETGPLSLGQALVLALERHPELAVFSWDIRAAEARTIQARLRPNPELSLEIEEIRWGRGPESIGRTTSVGSDGVLGFEEETENGAHSGLSGSSLASVRAPIRTKSATHRLIVAR